MCNEEEREEAREKKKNFPSLSLGREQTEFLIFFLSPFFFTFSFFRQKIEIEKKFAPPLPRLRDNDRARQPHCRLLVLLLAPPACSEKTPGRTGRKKPEQPMSDAAAAADAADPSVALQSRADLEANLTEYQTQLEQVRN